MYQKEFTEANSAAPAKSIPFMERMYMKIEAICVEADKNPSLLFQEAGKYFEHQGANVRKLASEFIRDLLPPPEEELSECKHAEKCQCSRFQAQKLAKDADPENAELNRQHQGDEAAQEQKAADSDETRGSPEVIQLEQNDTVVEAGDQVAEWYVSDEYKRSSGIMENWSGNGGGNCSKAHESDSEWEML